MNDAFAMGEIVVEDLQTGTLQPSIQHKAKETILAILKENGNFFYFCCAFMVNLTNVYLQF